MTKEIMTEHKIMNVLQEQVSLYEIAIGLCYSHGKPKSAILRQLSERLRDKLIEHQKEIINLQRKVAEN